MFGHVPERGEQLGLIGTRHKLDRSAFARLLFEIFGQEQRLAAVRLGIEHGDAYDLGRERPEIELAAGFRRVWFRGPGSSVIFSASRNRYSCCASSKSVERQRGSLDVKNNGGHAGINRQDAGDAKKIFQICSPVSQ